MSEKLRLFTLLLSLLLLCGIFMLKSQSFTGLSLFSNYLRCNGEYQLEEFEKWTKQKGYIGYQLSIQRADGGLVDCSFGVSNKIAINSRMSSTESLPYASMTKIITAHLINEAVSEGKISYQSKLSDHVSRYSGTGIRIEHLINHTAGFDKEVEGDIVFEPYPNCSEKSFDESSNGPTHPPGVTYSYSNYGYCLLGIVLERVNLKSIDQQFLDFYESHASSGMKSPTQLPIEYFRSPVKFYESNSPVVSIPNNLHTDYFVAYGGWSGSANILANLLANSQLSKGFFQHELPLFNVKRSTEDIDCFDFKARNCLIGGAYFNRVVTNTHNISVIWKNGRLPGTESTVLFKSSGDIIVFIANSSDSMWLTRSSELAYQLSML